MNNFTILQEDEQQENIVTEKCDEPIFGRQLVVLGRCGLFKGHDGKHLSQVETKAETDRMSTRQLDLDLGEAWKPIRDLPSCYQ